MFADAFCHRLARRVVQAITTSSCGPEQDKMVGEIEWMENEWKMIRVECLNTSAWPRAIDRVAAFDEWMFL